MLEVRFCGGLGNQMFQYAFCQYLRSAQNEVRLNISDYRIHKHHQGFELEKIFGIEDDYNNKRSEFGIDKTVWYIRIICKLFHISIIRSNEYYEKKEITNISQKKISQDVFLVGYWQNYQYIEPIETILREKFCFPELKGKNYTFYQQIGSKETVAIHIRRGDYLKIQGMASICNKDYYENAIRYMRNNIEYPVFVFFSDDPEWCKEEFKDMEALFVDWNKGNESYRDMQLMSLCKHNIIANSTFSWWGAWLNKNDGKVMIAPRRWWPGIDENPLCGKQWILF